MIALYNGDLDIAQLLLQYGADVNAKNRYGKWTIIPISIYYL